MKAVSPRGGAPHHALGDQLRARGAEGGHLAAEHASDLAGAVRTGPEFRHGAQVAFLGRGQPVEAGTKEPRVEGGGDLA